MELAPEKDTIPPYMQSDQYFTKSASMASFFAVIVAGPWLATLPAPANAAGPDAAGAPFARICRPDGERSSVPEWVRAGQDVPRLLWFTNAAAQPARFTFRFETSADGHAISTDEDTDTLPAGASRLLPVGFRVPDNVTAHSAGTMRLLAVLDSVVSTDEVPFRVYSPEPAPASIPVFDPAGAVSNLLVSLDCTATRPPSASFAGPLVVGPDALQQTDAPLTNLVQCAIEGYRVLAFAQPVDWLLRQLSMRAIEPVACTATSAAPVHGVLQGLAGATGTAHAVASTRKSKTGSNAILICVSWIIWGLANHSTQSATGGNRRYYTRFVGRFNASL